MSSMQESKRFFVAAFCSAAGSMVACAHATAEMPPAAQASSHERIAPDAAATRETPGKEEPAVSAQSAEPVAPDPYTNAAPVSAKSIGHTSYVLKVTLEGGLAAAYKPGSTLPFGSHRYRGEIAAYRLARALGLENVPRAIPRAFSATALHDAFPTPKGSADFDRKAIVDSGGQVHGALMPWITDYRVLPLEEPAWRARWEGWLMNPGARIPEGQETLASSISTMLVFDYITANWDRWSGANVARDGAEGTLLFVDNDGAFYEHPAREPLAAQLALIRRVARFSQSFVSALHGLDDANLRAAFGDEAPGTPLLSDPVITGVESRLKTVLGVIDTCARHEWIE
jgi:hypothetical protein